MDNAPLTDRSSRRIGELTEVSSRLKKELMEIAKEEERQTLLNALSESQTRNTDLEIALAKLAREQDRVALFERERVLKRAQVAQATAALVYEANWARNRMESEMRQAKLRAMVFNNSDSSPPSLPGPSIPEILTAVPVVGSSPTALLKKVSQDSRRSSTGQSVATTVKLDERNKTPQLPFPPVRPQSPGPNPPALDVSQQEVFQQVIPKDTSSISPTIPDEPGITELVSSAAANVFGTIMNSYTSMTSPSATRSESISLPLTTAPLDSHTRPSDEKRRQIPKIASTPPLPDQQQVGRPSRFGPKVGAYLPPQSSETNTLKVVRTIRNSTKGEWTNPQLLTEAEVTMTMQSQARDELLWTNKSLIMNVFGVPNSMQRSVDVKPEWIELEELWIQKAAKIGPGDKTKQIVGVDSLIAEKTGVDRKVLVGESEVGEMKSDEDVKPTPVAPTTEAGEEPTTTKKKKNGCVIM
jgi:hypothetical protein